MSSRELEQTEQSSANRLHPQSVRGIEQDDESKAELSSIWLRRSAKEMSAEDRADIDEFGRGSAVPFSYTRHNVHLDPYLGNVVCKVLHLAEDLLRRSQEIVGESMSDTASVRQVPPHLANVLAVSAIMQEISGLVPLFNEFKEQEEIWGDVCRNYHGNQVANIKRMGGNVEESLQPASMGEIYTLSTYTQHYNIDEGELTAMSRIRLLNAVQMCRTNHLYRGLVVITILSELRCLEYKQSKTLRLQEDRGMDSQ